MTGNYVHDCGTQVILMEASSWNIFAHAHHCPSRGHGKVTWLTSETRREFRFAVGTWNEGSSRPIASSTKFRAAPSSRSGRPTPRLGPRPLGHVKHGFGGPGVGDPLRQGQRRRLDRQHLPRVRGARLLHLLGRQPRVRLVPRRQRELFQSRERNLRKKRRDSFE